MIDMKKIKSQLKSEDYFQPIRNEIEIMKSLEDPHFVKLIEALEDDHSSKIYLVMELCSKGALLSDTFWRSEEKAENLACFAVLSDLNKSLPADKVKHYLRQTAEGLYYCRFALMQCTMS